MTQPEIRTAPGEIRTRLPAFATRKETLPNGAVFLDPNNHAAFWLWPETGDGITGTGVIGCFAADSPENTTRLLEICERQLKACGCRSILGPLDGGTWYSYRFVVEQGTRPRFGLEPWNPPEWPVWWSAAGYREAAHYFSAETTDLTRADPRLDRVRDRMERSGLVITNALGTDGEKLLTEIHTLSLDSFANNAYYTPISFEEFASLYRPIFQRVPMEGVLLARRAGVLEGFLFSAPDPLEIAGGSRPTTLILKTVAVRPGRINSGLGALLVEESQRRAHIAAFSRVIHALMHESNRSLNLSHNYAVPFRRYALFEKKLA